MTDEQNGTRAIITRILEEDDKRIAKLLVLGVRKDGSSFSLDNGLTADEAKTLTIHFHAWLDNCLGREQENDRD